MGILRKNRFKENTPFEVKIFHDEPISALHTVKDIFTTEFVLFNSFELDSLFKTGPDNTLKAIQSK